MKSAKENLPQQQDSEVENIHEFSLKPLDQKASRSNTVVVDFTPQISESKTVSIIPRLSQSRDSFKPLFQCLFLNNLLQINGQIPQQSLTVKEGPSRTPISQRSSQGKTEGSKPRPTSKYCQLCKQKFNEDYLDHIKHIVHVNNLKANPFQKYIHTLIEDFKKNIKRQRPIFAFPKDDGVSGKSKKKVKIQLLATDFSLKNANSTESTTNSTAIIDPVQKKQLLSSLKE